MKQLKAEIDEKMDFNIIRYSQVWEDHAVLEAALDIKANDRVLSITSGGCNTLALALQNPKSLTSLDLSPAQTAYFDLKLAGYQNLDYEGFLGLIGALGRPQSTELYQQLKSHLKQTTITYFEQREQAFSRPLLGSGRLESFMEKFRQIEVFDTLTPLLVSLLEVSDLTAQKTRLRKIYESGLEKIFRKFFTRENIAKLGRDPAQFAYVDQSKDVSQYFWEKFVKAFDETLFRDNPYLQYFLLGEYPILNQAPLYLREENFANLGKLASKIDVRTESLETFINKGEIAKYQKINLSNIFEYMSDEASRDMLNRIADLADPGTRFAFWNMMVDRKAPARSDIIDLCQNNELALPGDRFCLYRAFRCYEVRR
jgi:S-adenosylmethionine-diacylglycerol 3-amino-3-carboxypropyl transferase